VIKPKFAEWMFRNLSGTEYGCRGRENSMVAILYAIVKTMVQNIGSKSEFTIRGKKNGRKRDSNHCGCGGI
jgi:hypothetical protein